MELKGGQAVCLITTKLSFNRTFMELKGQSRLHKREPPASFNRTFMELKVTGCGVPESRAQFQSHLYGIESCVSLLGCELGNVSIAPLWNWKWGFPCSPARLHGFNRTFMELKVATPSASMAAFCVSIAPLWNWKSTAIGSPDLTRWFQSHLYGIESVQ